MSPSRFCGWLALAACFAATVAASDLPDDPAQQRISGVRPFYVEWRAAATAPNAAGVNAPAPLRQGFGGQGGRVPPSEFTVLYPLFTYRNYRDTYQWSVFDLIVHYGRHDGAPPAPSREPQTFDIWPVYFSRQTGDPATTYHAVLPFGGRMQDKLFYEELKFVLFPLYLQSKRHQSITTWYPWPLVHSTHGVERGFAFLPLFGWKSHPGQFEHRFYLWPFGWHDVDAAAPERPAGTGPTEQVGILPFYTATRSPDVQARNYLWPFFGYTDRTAPYRYHETRYFYPFLVQGRGENHYRSRYGPFYTHSRILDVEKVWAPWPLYRRAQWQDGDILQTKINVAYFLFLKQTQHKISNPAAAPAVKAHYWPLLSYWDNGNGLRQWQALSPFEVFFPNNKEMRASYSPLFALYRREERPNGDTRSSLFWGAISWGRTGGQSQWKFLAWRMAPPRANLAALEAGALSRTRSTGAFGTARSTRGDSSPR